MKTLEIACAWLLLLLPITFIAWVCATGPEIPHNDYWAWVHHIVAPEGFSSEPSDWTKRATNQLLTGTYLIYALNLVATDGANQSLTLLSWLFAVGVLVLLGLWIHRSLGRSLPLSRWTTVGASWLLFSPLLAMFWIMGFTGVSKLGAVFFSVLAIHFWVTYERSRRTLFLFSCIGAVGLAMGLFTAGLVLLPLLALAAAPRVRRQDRGLIAFLAALALLTLLWGLGYETGLTGDHPAVGRGGVTALLLYPFCFLGSPFTRDIEVGLGLGLLGVAAVVVLAAHNLRGADTGRDSQAWWLLIGFAAGNAALTALARSPMGLGQAFATRYMVFPVLFWISLGVLVMIHARRPSRRWLALGAVCLLVVASYLNGWTYYQALRYRGSLEPAARIALQRGLSDPDAIHGVVTPVSWQFDRMVPIFRARHWIPFEHGELEAEPTRRTGIVEADLPEARVWAFRSFEESHYRLAGRVPRSLDLGTELLMFDRSGLEIGRAAVVPAPRPDLDLHDSFWIGYLSPRGVEEIFLALHEGDVVAELRCCDAARPLAMDFDPYLSPHPNWFYAGTYRSAWLQSRVELRQR